MKDGERRPADPGAGAAPVVTAMPDAPPPRAPRELDPDPDETRAFSAENEEWIARVAGKGAGGTGAYGLGLMDAVHFACAGSPELPLREALLPRGRFIHLFDEELCALLARATPIVHGEPSSDEGERPSRR